MEKTAWEFVCKELAELFVVEAKLTTWNGGQKLETVFITEGRGRVDRTLTFEGAGGMYGNLACPVDVERMAVGFHELGLEVSVWSPSGSNCRDLFALWPAHEKMIRTYLGERYAVWAKKAKLLREIEDLKEKLKKEQAALRHLEEI